jgi:hypothetical protein
MRTIYSSPDEFQFQLRPGAQVPTRWYRLARRWPGAEVGALGAAMAVHRAAAATAVRQRLVHDPLDRARASSALGAAAEAAIHLPRGAGGLRGSHGVADIVIAENVAGADDHGASGGGGRGGRELLLILVGAVPSGGVDLAQKKSAPLRDSKLRTDKGNPWDTKVPRRPPSEAPRTDSTAHCPRHTVTEVTQAQCTGGRRCGACVFRSSAWLVFSPRSALISDSICLRSSAVIGLFSRGGGRSCTGM